MAKITGNGLTAEFGPDGNEVFIIAVTSISMDSAERPAIDITAASDSQRKAVMCVSAPAHASASDALNTKHKTQNTKHSKP